MRIIKIANNKRCIICRGCPGSGKSTLANQLGKGGIVLARDDFFMINGEYKFDPDMRGFAHLWNQGRARKAMASGISSVVIDNTNVTFSECSPYVKLAKENGYEVSYAEPDTPWKFDVDELTKRNQHSVPREVIQRMLDKWQPTETLGMDRTASAPIDTTGLAASGRLTDDEKELFSILTKVIRQRVPNTTVRVAGGWVRDKLMGKQPKDLDLMVDNLDAGEFARMVTESLGLSDPHLIRANPEQSKNVPTARMYIPLSSGTKLEIDVAKARQDVYDDKSRIPSTMDATADEDAARRDLTINSLFYDVVGDKVEDPTGKGLADLRDHIIRTPLDPVKTFSDDPLRILRAIRFSARYGWDIAPEVKKAIFDPALRSKLRSKVSRERKGIEIRDMLSGGYPEVAIELLIDSGIFEDLLSEAITGTDRVGRMSPSSMEQDSPHHDLNWAEHTKALARGVARKYRGKDKDKVFSVMMAAMLHDVGKLDSASRQQQEDGTTYHGHEDASEEITEAFMRSVKLEQFSKPVEALVGNHMRPHQLTRHDSNKTAVRRFVRQMSELGIGWDDVVNLAAADAMAKGKKPEDGTEEGYAKLLADGEEAFRTMPAAKGGGVKPIVDGKDIMNHFGVKEGVLIGQMLKKVKDMMDENPTLTREEALVSLSSHFKDKLAPGWLPAAIDGESKL